MIEPYRPQGLWGFSFPLDNPSLWVYDNSVT